MRSIYLLNQARAILAQTHAQAGESFRELTPDYQDYYLCLVSELVGQAVAELEVSKNLSVLVPG